MSEEFSIMELKGMATGKSFYAEQRIGDGFYSTNYVRQQRYIKKPLKSSKIITNGL